MHFPEFTLVAGTCTCFSSLERLLVETEREVKEEVSDLACIDVFFCYLRDRLTDVP
jgi:hypothetical protein